MAFLIAAVAVILRTNENTRTKHTRKRIPTVSISSFGVSSLTSNDDNPPHQPASTAKIAADVAPTTAKAVCGSHFSSPRNEPFGLSCSFGMEQEKFFIKQKLFVAHLTVISDRRFIGYVIKYFLLLQGKSQKTVRISDSCVWLWG